MESNAASSQAPPAPPGSAPLTRAPGGDHGVTPRGLLAPEPAERDTLPPRRNTREVAGPTASSERGTRQTAACGWFLWEESARSARA